MRACERARTLSRPICPPRLTGFPRTHFNYLILRIIRSGERDLPSGTAEKLFFPINLSAPLRLRMRMSKGGSSGCERVAFPVSAAFARASNPREGWPRPTDCKMSTIARQTSKCVRSIQCPLQYVRAIQPYVTPKSCEAQSRDRKFTRDRRSNSPTPRKFSCETVYAERTNVPGIRECAF